MTQPHLAARLARRESGFLLFGLTPPRRSVAPDEAQRIADVTLERLGGLDLDGLLLYDIVDESDRTEKSGPFPYLPTIDPSDYEPGGCAGTARSFEAGDPPGRRRDSRASLRHRRGARSTAGQGRPRLFVLHHPGRP